jgi:Ca-activated chloride channel family protein
MNLTFENPVYLWYLLSLPLLLFTHIISLRYAKRKAMRFANFQTLKRISGEHFVTKNIPILVIRLVIVTLLVFAAAGVQVWYEAERLDMNYVIAIDTSASMSAADFPPSRIAIAKEYASRFVESTGQGVSIGVLSFSGVTTIEEPLTTDKYEALGAIDSVGETRGGGTDLPGAIVTGTNLLLAQPERGKAIIVFSDGSTTLGNFMDRSTERAIAYAQEHQVIVHTVGIGSESGPIGYLPEYYNISSVYDPETLMLLSNSTGGSYMMATDLEELEAAYTFLLADSKDSLASARLDLSLLIAAIGLLFVEWGLISTRFRRIT